MSARVVLCMKSCEKSDFGVYGYFSAIALTSGGAWDLVACGSAGIAPFVFAFKWIEINKAKKKGETLSPFLRVFKMVEGYILACSYYRLVCDDRTFKLSQWPLHLIPYTINWVKNKCNPQVYIFRNEVQPQNTAFPTLKSWPVAFFWRTQCHSIAWQLFNFFCTSVPRQYWAKWLFLGSICCMFPFEIEVKRAISYNTMGAQK